MAAGIRTPRPVWLADALGPLPRYSILATEAIPESENVIQRWTRLDSEVERRELADNQPAWKALAHADASLFHGRRATIELPKSAM